MGFGEELPARLALLFCLEYGHILHDETSTAAADVPVFDMIIFCIIKFEAAADLLVLYVITSCMTRFMM